MSRHIGEHELEESQTEDLQGRLVNFFHWPPCQVRGHVVQPGAPSQNSEYERAQKIQLPRIVRCALQKRSSECVFQLDALQDVEGNFPFIHGAGLSA